MRRRWHWMCRIFHGFLTVICKSLTSGWFAFGRLMHLWMKEMSSEVIGGKTTFPWLVMDVAVQAVCKCYGKLINDGRSLIIESCQSASEVYITAVTEPSKWPLISSSIRYMGFCSESQDRALHSSTESQIHEFPISLGLRHSQRFCKHSSWSASDSH